MKFIDDAKLKLGVWARERKERAAEKKAASLKRAAEHGAPLLWIWFLVGVAVCTLAGSTWMLVVFIAGSVGHVDWAFDWRAGNDGSPGRWTWFAEANIHAIYGVGLFLFCLGIAAFNAIWLHIRHYLNGLFRKVSTGIGIAIALFMVSGAIVTQQWGTDARTRDQVVGANTARAGVAAIDAELESLNARWQTLCAQNLTTYQAQACRSGEVAWQERIQTARQQRDYQLPGIERALADAREGDRMQARMLVLRRERAEASVQTVEAEAATVVSTGFMATFARFLEEIRKPFIAVLGELLAMTMFGVALAAWRSRVPSRDVQRSGWADESHRIEDLREQEAVTPQPMKPAREVVTDAETGEELIRITPKPHWRKQKGKKQKVETQPEIPPDETGVSEDGGKRTAITIGGLVEVPSAAAPDVKDEVAPQRDGEESDEQPAEEQPSEDVVSVQPETPEVTEQEAAELLAELEATDDEPAEQIADEAGDSEGRNPAEQEAVEVDAQTESPEREPETDPSRLIAAE